MTVVAATTSAQGNIEGQPPRVLLATVPRIHAQEPARSLDLAINGTGISIGDSRGVNGLRLNFRDTRLERVNGVNITMWHPTGTSHGIVNGAAIGLPLTGARQITGLAIGLVGATVEERFRGIGVGGFGVMSAGRLEGLMLGGHGVVAWGGIRGISIGGLGVGSAGDITGLSLGLVGVGTGRTVTGVQAAGIGVLAGRIEGITLAGALAGSEFIRGVVVAGGYVRVDGDGDSIGMMQGVTVSAVNHIVGTQRGLAIGIVNYASTLNGIQLGVLNYARNNPRPFRLLPIINVNVR